MKTNFAIAVVRVEPNLFSVACVLIVVLTSGVLTNTTHAQPCAPAWTYYLDPVGPDRHVRSLVAHNGALYARGDWSMVAGAPGNNVAVFNGTNWSGNFATNWPYSGSPAGNTGLVPYQGKLYAPLGGGSASSNYTIGVILSGGGWVSWPTNGLWQNPNVQLNINRCWRAAAHQSSLIAAGTFFHLPPGATSSVRRLFAKFNGATWSQMDGGYGPDTLASDRIESLVPYKGALYVGGLFSRFRSDEQGGTNTPTPAANIACYSGGSWQALPNGGLNGRVYTMAVYRGDLYVGGDFTATFDGSLSLLRIARLRNGAWERVGGGLAGSRPRSMTVADDGRGRALFIGATSGEANNVPPPTADTVPVSGVVRWNGTRYSALGDGITGGTAVYAMARYDPGTGEALFVGADSLRNPDDLSFFGRTARWGPAPMVDSDGDGIFDIWETSGIDADCDGTIDLPLHTMGADPLRKDIFVEIDTMMTNYCVPSAEALNDVVAAFAAVPNAYLKNPNGSNGINLHLVLSETNIPFAVAWTNLVDTDGDGEGEWFTEFDTAKDQFFGSAAERSTNRWPAIRAARERVFRYCIFANRIFATNDSTSGLAELPGNDFIVSLGGWSTPGGTPTQQAGTLMHELGHTLGLKHGGVDHVNCKPNYVSVMNYYWQTRRQVNSNWWRLDYSGEALTSLNESALNERIGVGRTNSIYQRFWTRYGATTLATNAGIVTTNYVTPPVRLNGSPVDWNNDGVTNAAPVMGDLTILGDCWYLSPDELLRGQEDWSALQYHVYLHPNYDEGAHSETTLEDEITLEISQNLDALPPITLCPLTVQLARGEIVLTWNCAGILASAPSVTGPWTRHESAASPFNISITTPARFFRLED